LSKGGFAAGLDQTAKGLTRQLIQCLLELLGLTEESETMRSPRNPPTKRPLSRQKTHKDERQYFCRKTEL